MANMYGYNSSSAHKLNDSYDYRKLSESVSRPTEVRTVSKKHTKRAELTKAQIVSKRIKNTLQVAFIFVTAFVIINRYVAINEANTQISELKEEYNSVVAANQDLQAKIDRAVDLKKLQTIASDKFGMIRPERYQMFYIDMNQADFSESVAQTQSEDAKESVAVNGVPGTIIGAMKIFK